MERLTVHEMIDAIRGNYPPQQYAMLRESLDHAIDLMTAEAEGRLLVLPIAKTNADKIRQMTDEELAEFLAQRHFYDKLWCKRWLEQEVESDD